MKQKIFLKVQSAPGGANEYFNIFPKNSFLYIFKVSKENFRKIWLVTFWSALNIQTGLKTVWFNQRHFYKATPGLNLLKIKQSFKNTLNVELHWQANMFLCDV